MIQLKDSRYYAIGGIERNVEMLGRNRLTLFLNLFRPRSRKVNPYLDREYARELSRRPK